MSSIYDPRYREIITVLIELRVSKNMTQVQLASLLKKPQSYVAKVENFERRLDFLELHDWLTHLDEKITSFLKDKF